jgi:hypothetical protein
VVAEMMRMLELATALRTADEMDMMGTWSCGSMINAGRSLS